MNRIAVLIAAFVFALLVVPGGAQAQPGQGSSGRAAPAPDGTTCPSSTTLDELIKALDDAVSGPRDKDRTCLRDLLLPDARLTPVRKQADGTFGPRILTVDDWINAVRSQGGPAFYERQVKVKSETYGHFAHLWNTYEIRPTPDGKAEVIGINSVQAVFDGNRWRVLSVLWEADTTAGPVPDKYLP